MARKNGNGGGTAGAAGLRKPKSNLAYQDWQSAHRDIKRRTKLYQKEPAEGKAQGSVYILRDAIGTIKVGYSYEMLNRLLVWQYGVTEERRPVRLALCGTTDFG